MPDSGRRSGVLGLRPELPDDAPFRLRLFRETHGIVLAGLDPVMVELLLRQQMAGQAMTYAARYPEARHEIIERDGVSIGRMVVDDKAEVVTLVDIALLAEARCRGLGTRLLRGLIATADATSRPMRLSVDPLNSGALRLYARLGFGVVATHDMTLTMERPPASPASELV